MEPPPVEPDEPLEEDELPGADPESMVRDFGSHPMMHRIQDALYKQLQREYERTTLEMREKETEVTAVNRKREDVGVELYGTQQQLARLQMALEALHSQSHGLVEFRRKEGCTTTPRVFLPVTGTAGNENPERFFKTIS